MKALVSFVFFFMAIFSLCAQSTFLGKVSDSESQTLPGAQVILLKADTLFAATLTDQDGKFVFRDIPADVYGLQILVRMENSFSGIYLLMFMGCKSWQWVIPLSKRKSGR